jgi:hypothetical protein
MTQATNQPIVSLLKLSSGDEIITEVVIEKLEGGQEVIHMVNPCNIVRHEQEDGTVNAEFTPIAVFYANGTIQVSGSQIVWSGQPVEDFAEVYLTKFGRKPVTEESVIAVPAEKKLIVPTTAKAKKSK